MKMYPIVLLVGGYGTRLGRLTKKIPKAMIKINQRPFLYYLLNHLSSQGFKDVILCTGYLGSQIKKYVGNGKKFNLDVKYSVEKKFLLGTAGCIKKALPLLSNNFFIIYGDTFLPIQFKKIQEVYLKKKAKALITIYKNTNKYDFSNISLSKGNIYYEKNSKKKNMKYIDYGLSIFNKNVFKSLMFKKINDLSNVLNILSKKKLLKYAIVKKRFYEIGSIKGLKEAKKILVR
jgi:N-acetyl-alpha-D-muramate 1-phosphate uridylyltransferase